MGIPTVPPHQISHWRDDKALAAGRAAITRRRFLQGMALTGATTPILAACGTGGSPSGTAQGGSKSLTFVSWGGSYGEAVEKYLVKPFEEKTGISVQLGVNSELAPVKSQVQSGNVQWDLVDLADGDFFAGVQDNLFERLDYGRIDTSKVPEYAIHKNGIEYALFLAGMGYDRRQIPDARAPETWEAFWDTTRYKGLRSMCTKIVDLGTLEFALMADGVPMNQVYPVDVERALASISELGSGNIVWYRKNQEPINFLQQQRGPLAQTFNGRVLLANREGAQLGFVYDRMQLSSDFLAIPRGAPNKELAFRFIEFVVNNNRAAANFMEATSYAISNTEADELLPPNMADKVPTSPALEGKFFKTDQEWWARHYNEVVPRFEKFLATDFE